MQKILNPLAGHNESFVRNSKSLLRYWIDSRYKEQTSWLWSAALLMTLSMKHYKSSETDCLDDTLPNWLPLQTGGIMELLEF